MKIVSRLYSGVKFTLQTPWHVRDNKRTMEELSEKLATSNTLLLADVHNVQTQINELVTKLSRADERINDTVHQISSLAKAKTNSSDRSAGHKADEVLADNHLLDNFYVQFENNFRGTEAEIKDRQKAYLPYFTENKKTYHKKPVVDIGCGRGEFVELMAENDIRCVGLDLNEAMVRRVVEKGYEAIESDATQYLRSQKQSSLSAITGFQIVEHIPFGALIELFDECYRTLSSGGFTIFETPNPENVTVASHNFYMDPSHLHPIPPALLEFTMHSRGFSRVEILRLHPADAPKNTSSNPALSEMVQKLYGFQDYAVIAYK